MKLEFFLEGFKTFCVTRTVFDKQINNFLSGYQCLNLFIAAKFPSVGQRRRNLTVPELTAVQQKQH